MTAPDLFTQGPVKPRVTQPESVKGPTPRCTLFDLLEAYARVRSRQPSLEDLIGDKPL